MVSKQQDKNVNFDNNAIKKFIEHIELEKERFTPQCIIQEQ